MRDKEGRFLGFQTPRYTPTPDEVFDELLAELAGSELKVLLYVIRRTFGFKRDSDHISLSQMVSGICRRDGTVLDLGTGLSKDSVVIAVKSLVKKGILVQSRVYSDKAGFEASEYALKILTPPLSDFPTRRDVRRIGQGLVGKSDIQETAIQETSTTFPNVSRKHFYRGPVDKSERQKEEYLAKLVLEVCHDRQSIGYYRQVVHALPERVVHEALSQVQEAARMGRIRERPGAMFTDLIKRKAAELGIEFGAEKQNKELSESEIKAETSTREGLPEMAHMEIGMGARR